MTFLLFFPLAAAIATSALAQKPLARAKPAAPAAPVAVPRVDFIATMDAEFHKMDADKDGKVTRKEVEAFQQAMSAFAVDARRRALFSMLDTDKNGALSPAEFARLQMPLPSTNAAPVLAQADLNHDGTITLVEFRTARLANFDRMDSDKDGVVSVAEMKAAGLLR